jgi:hypothetical protein
LAVVRQELAEEADFSRVLWEAMHRLETLEQRDRPRWQEIFETMLTWAYDRRPLSERATIQAEAAQLDARHRKEIKKMGKTIAEGLIEEGMEMGELRLARSLLLEHVKALSQGAESDETTH